MPEKSWMFSKLILEITVPPVCRYYVLVQQKDKWDEQESCIRKEKEELGQQIQKNRLLQQENLQLKAEVDRLGVFKL